MAHNANKLFYDEIICYVSHKKEREKIHTQHTNLNRKTNAVNGVELRKSREHLYIYFGLVDVGFPLSCASLFLW